MRPLFGGFAVALLLAAGGGVVRAEDLPDNPLRGRLQFERGRCNQCHAIAETRHGIGPDLGGGGFEGTFLDLGAAMWNHVPGMTLALEDRSFEWAELTADEIYDLMAFLYYIDYLGRPGVAETGERLFRTRGCASCHSVAGTGGDVGPDLADLDRFVSPLYLAQAVWNHGPSMFETMREMRMSAPTFAEGDLADLSAFIRQRSRRGPTERLLLAPGNPNRGRGLFRDKSCVLCHEVEGRAGGSGPDLRTAELPRSAEGIAGAMWNHALVMSETMRERGLGWPRLTTTELADLVAYLYFLPFEDPPGKPRRGAEVFAERSCAACHSTPDASHPGPELRGDSAPGSDRALVAAMWNHAPIMKEAILGEGRPWPELSGQELRDLLAFLAAESARDDESAEE